MNWLSELEFVDAVEAATRAPSMLNSQPWQFRLGDDEIDLLVDPRRRLSRVDASGWAARIGCGAALFNLRLALTVRGKPADVALMPDADDRYLLARLIPQPARPATPAEVRLHRAIAHRHSNRAPFAEEPIPLPVRAELIAAARAENAWLDLLIGPIAVEATALMVNSAHDLLARDADYQAELAEWTHRAEPTTDGVPVSTGGPAPRPDELLPRRDFGGPQLPAHRNYERDPLLAVLSAGGDWPTDQIQAGQALQRVLLTATDLGLAASMFSQPIEVPQVRDELRRAVGRQASPQMLLRLGYATRSHPSPRRPATEVIVTRQRGVPAR
jgi:nitroreductase